MTAFRLLKAFQLLLEGFFCALSGPEYRAVSFLSAYNNRNSLGRGESIVVFILER